MTLKDLMNRAFAQHAERVAVRHLVPSQIGGELEYKPITYSELRAQRDAVAAGMASMAIGKGDRVGILTDGGLEPLLVFLATDLLGVCAVPLCLKSPPEILAHNLHHSGVVLVVADTGGDERITALRSSLEGGGPRIVLTEGSRDGTVSWAELVGSQESPPEVEVLAADESKILYTSGSSGLPKGVVQTHANIVANVEEVWDAITDKDPFRFFKSAPDYHSMGILNIYYPLAKGWALDMARSPDRVLSDIRHSEPEGLLTVPLVLDKVYGNVRKEIDAGGIKGWLVSRSVEARQRKARGRAGSLDRLLDATLGGVIIGKIKHQLATRVGRNLELLVVGSAKADPEALDFFQDVLDIRTYEGYGTTECAPLIATNQRTGRKTGTVGRPLLTAKLVSDGGAEIGYCDPEAGVCRGSDGEVGELWVSGRNVMQGYLDDEEETARVLVRDEAGRLWYRTGDLFSLDTDGFLTFSGRVGRQFKLANGEFVNPELLERIFARVALVEHVLVAGMQSWRHPLIIVAIDIDEASRLPELQELPKSEIRGSQLLNDHLQQQLLREADSFGLPGHERPHKVLVLPESLDEDSGTLTRGLKKIVPGAVEERYRALIDETMAS